MVIKFDIILAHEEKWIYPDPDNPGQKLPFTRYTMKFYCTKRSCILSRLPYFDPVYLEILREVRSALKDTHRSLIQAELGCDEM